MEKMLNVMTNPFDEAYLLAEDADIPGGKHYILYSNVRNGETVASASTLELLAEDSARSLRGEIAVFTTASSVTILPSPDFARIISRRPVTFDDLVRFGRLYGEASKLVRSWD